MLQLTRIQKNLEASSKRSKSDEIIDTHTSTRSLQKSKSAQRLIKTMIRKISHHTSDSVQGEIFSIFPQVNISKLSYYILSYKATSDPDIIYLHQAMKEPDRKAT